MSAVPVKVPTVVASGSNSTYVPDYWSFIVYSPCLRVGGNYLRDCDYGLFFVGYSGDTYTDASIGCRLMELP